MQKYEVHVSACETYEVEAENEMEASNKASENFTRDAREQILSLDFEIDKK